MYRQHSNHLKGGRDMGTNTPECSKELTAVPCTVLRGGTSKGVFLPEEVVPEEKTEREKFLLALMGSPDPRQIDGLGGADLLTTKVAIIGKPSRDDADLDYTFAQVGITQAKVHFDMNCGNISSAVGVYAVEKGLVPLEEPYTTVRIHNRNTQTILLAKVPVGDGHARVDGEWAIDGVPGTGAAISLDFRLTAGGATGSLLPTGHVYDVVDVPELGAVTVSVVDIANLCFVVQAEHVGLKSEDIPRTPGPELLFRMDRLQRAVAHLLGISEGQLTPIPIIVAPPHDFRTLTDQPFESDAVDIVSEVIGGQPLTLHKAFPGTASVTLAVASRIPGTIAYEMARQNGAKSVRIGHPSGRMDVDAMVSVENARIQVLQASYQRTARLIMDGITYLRSARL